MDKNGIMCRRMRQRYLVTDWSRTDRNKRKHPDFEEIKNSEDFHSWAKNQPQSIQDWIYSNTDDADLATRALDLFKNDIGMAIPEKKKSSSKQNKSAADMVSTKTTKVDPKQDRVGLKGRLLL